MNRLDAIKTMAQREANKAGADMAILNLNTIGSALYVVRTYRPEMEAGRYAHQFVERVKPDNAAR